ncbi:MAG: pantoate--beta-alanine ligase [Flavobacteriales bacterium]|nr:pantoate--beta-alanine ligase [Flavobacteriales bacterium]
MRVLTNINSLNQLLESSRIRNKSIGFVPTMGALHEGHLSLVKLAQKDCDVIVCSIFINPTQFNDPNDLENYPITTEADIKLLEEQSCDILFMPNVTEMYPQGLNTKQYLLNGIDKVLEGRKRPGHFDGVCTIVHRLFSIVKPNTAFFGEKDFQQVAVIRQMVNSLSLPIQIKTGETIRENDGLAKSSRNTLLSTTQRKKARHIYTSLKKIKSLFGKVDCAQLKELIKDDFNQLQDMQLDYIEIINPQSFKPLQGKDANQEAVALIAVFLGKVRLIDNLSLND